MSNPSWLNPYNYVTIVQDGQDVVIEPTANQQLAAGTVQVTPNSEIPASLLATPPVGVSTQVKFTIPDTTPGAQ